MVTVEMSRFVLIVLDLVTSSVNVVVNPLDARYEVVDSQASKILEG